MFTLQQLDEEKQNHENFLKMLQIDESLKITNYNEEYLWNSDKMSFMIINDMANTNGDTGFNFVWSFTKYMAIRFKFVKDKTVRSLLLDFYENEKYHYDAVIYGTKIFDYCKSHHRSYIYSIFEMVSKYEGLESDEFVYMKPLFGFGHKMEFAKLNSDGTISYLHGANF